MALLLERERLRSVALLFLGGALLVSDRLGKQLAVRLLLRGERFSYEAVLGPVGFVPSLNRVLAFSLPVPNVWIWPVGLMVLLVLTWRAVRERGAVRWGMAFVLMGAASNLLDRVTRGGVVDYLSFTNFFPAFNIADLCVLGGVIVWCVASLSARGVQASVTRGTSTCP